MPADERLTIAEFLCNNQTNSFLQHFKPEWALCVNFSIDDKIKLIRSAYPSFKLADVFPWTAELSAGINKNEFLQSFFVQPDLFIRVRKGAETIVKGTLAKADIIVKDEGNGCLSMPNGTKLEAIFPEQNWFEVQDYSSQQTAQWFKPKAGEAWWDACAASGGKSLLLHEQQPNIKFVVSDIRESILANLDERFQNAGLVRYQKKLLDLTQNPDPVMHDYAFDGIILDAPCSGSGTWGRTPEMISQFQPQKIEFFQKLQQNITRNVVKYLRPGKPLIYITCSAFKAENEEAVDFMIKELGLKLESMQVLKGYERRADTMFVARLVAPTNY
jgi:16S rRNA (cytosine967-C5)-methyltransferase